MWICIFITIYFVTPSAKTEDTSKGIFTCRREGSLNEFKCQDGTGCVSVKHMCDGISNCLDSSDEHFCPISRTNHTEDGLFRRRRQSTCGSDEWECLDGSCISLDNICNGVNDCLDRSDETHPFCKKLSSSKKSAGCILPPYPQHGTYEVSKFPNARPGQALDSFVLTVSCRKGFGVVDPNGGEGSGTQQLYCVNGEYQYQSMPRCVRFCKLNPDPSVRFTCHVPGVGFKTCKKYVAPGTLVNPICNSPIYYSTDGLSYMKCNFGFWDYIAQCRAECGRVTPEGIELVIDGKQAKRGELPWHVGIYRKTTKPYTQICGGTLIANNVVLSAAHCFWNDLKKKLPASDFAAAVGKLYRDWDSENDAGAQKSDLIDIRIPSRFQGAATNFQEDIAALILKTAFVYMTFIRPVCLYYDPLFEKLQLQQGIPGKVAGWGLTSTQGKPSNTLQVIDMPFVDVSTCIKNLPSSFTEYITSDKFCAGFTTGKALCKGDSGGGLAFPDRGLGVDRYYLRGIVSAAPRDDDKLCNNYVYTTFTMITKHQEFIKESLAASAENKCPQYFFQCDDGSCVDQGADCNGSKDCADGSDEADELCTPGFKPEPVPLTRPELATATKSPTTKPLCTLPPFPNYGTYATNIPESRPGQSFVSVSLKFTCTQGYGIVSTNGNAVKDSIVVKCSGGDWDQSIPKCVRVCKLSLDPTIASNYTCQAPTNAGLQLTDCMEYVSSGTVVSVSCNSPTYYSDKELPRMRCIAGSWDYYPRCKPECGRVIPINSALSSATPQLENTPWHVGIHRKTPKPYMQICGGSIVSNKIVISAAHCFWNNMLLPATDYAVAAGKIYRAWSDFRDETAQKSDVKSIDVPQRFNGFQEDIAILTLVTPFMYNAVVRPVCLDFDYDLDRSQLQGGMLGQAAGWGSTSIKGNFSPILKQVKLEYVKSSECISKTSITNDKFCAWFPNGTTGLCNGDGGGGLAFYSLSDQYFLRGIVSRPTDSENVCNDTPYSVFTKVIIHEDFIKQFL